MSDGIGFYDDPATFDAYWADRQNKESENDTLERPAMLELLGDVRGKRILDLGCGAGELGHILLARGAASYFGIDGSTRMIEAARQPATGDFRVAVADISSGELPRGTFDLIISSLVLHYLPDVQPLFAAVARARARFIFSAEHPIITSHYPPEGAVSQWIVDDYFVRGARQQPWKGGTVTKYHRTLEDYFRIAGAAGLNVITLRESEPQRENFVRDETFALRKRFPLFLFMELQAPPR